mgnify:CR=1 FL=1
MEADREVLMGRCVRRSIVCALALMAAPTPAAAQQGLASKYPGDKGLAKDPAVLYFLDFDNKAATLAWSKGKQGYGWTGAKDNVFAGAGALEIQQRKGTHEPYEIHPKIKESDQVYVRWYRKWQVGYDFTQHKMPGVYAKAPGASGAGKKPDGTDKYSCKLYVDFNQYPRFYSYHPEQKGIYGKLVGHYKNMRFRDVNSLKINEFTYSAYVGGSWTSEKDQKLWDDQIVVATTYIGPLSRSPVPADGPGGDGGVPAVDAGSSAADSAAAAADSSGAGADAGAGRASDGCSIGASRPPAGPDAWLLLLALVIRLRIRRRRWPACRARRGRPGDTASASGRRRSRDRVPAWR